MSNNASKLLSKHILTNTRTASSRLVVRPARTFATSTQLQKEHIETPSISNVHPNGYDSFDKRQREFRAGLAAGKNKADSQSSPSSAPGNPNAASASQVPLGESVDKTSLGSLSTSNSGESREEREKREASQWGGKSNSGPLSKLIYGTEEGRQMDQDMEHSFSQMLARGKYVHSIVMHDVKPDKIDEYTELVGNWYPKVANDPENKVHLVGSWRTEVGDCDTFSAY